MSYGGILRTMALIESALDPPRALMWSGMALQLAVYVDVVSPLQWKVTRSYSNIAFASVKVEVIFNIRRLIAEI